MFRQVLSGLRLQLWHLLRFGRREPASAAVYLSFATFFLLWRVGGLGQSVVTAGTIVGSVAIAVSSLGSDRVRDRWIIAAIGTLLVGLCASIDTSDQLRVATLKNEMEKEVQGYASQPANKIGFVAYLDQRLHDCLNRPSVDLDHCDDMESLLEHVDESNGSVPYFRGEILRYRGRLRDCDDQFCNYLEAKEHIRPTNVPDNGLAAVCEENGTGYCRQRTAWVCHTMANDFYRLGCAAAAPSERREWFTLAEEKIKCVQKEYPGGFNQRLHTRPLNTADLTAALRYEIDNPVRACNTALRTASLR